MSLLALCIIAFFSGIISQIGGNLIINGNPFDSSHDHIGGMMDHLGVSLQILLRILIGTISFVILVIIYSIVLFVFF